MIYRDHFPLYHATYIAYLPSILKYGLGGVSHRNWPDSTGDVCLTSDDDNAISFAEASPDMGYTDDGIYNSGIALLEINASGFSLYPDPNILKDESEDPNIHFVYRGIVPTDRIKLVKVIVNDIEWSTEINP